MEEYDHNKVEIADCTSENPLPSVQDENNVVGANLNGSAFAADCCIDAIDYDDVTRIRASITEQEEPRAERKSKKTSSNKSRVALLHSETYTKILHDAMKHIHQDRDLLLESLLYYCGFLRNTPKFLNVVPPKKATRKHMERFHQKHYLDLIAPHPIQYQHDSDVLNDDGIETDSWIPTSSLPHELLDSMGLVEDCALPTTDVARRHLWTYCQYVVGASLQAAHLLATNKADVAINWGGGRHHAHENKAGGFCFVNDIALAIQYLQKYHKRILYMDLDIHHCDGVQRAFYDTDTVLTMSFHRHEPGFFPSTSGSIREKGQYDTRGVGHNLNVPLPKSCTDRDFTSIFQEALTGLFDAYDPQAVVLCLGADGLQGDPLVGETDGWNLSPECLAECVRLTSMLCGEDNASFTSEEKENKTTSNERKHVMSANITSTRDSNNQGKHKTKRKLLILGGGGYNPANTARTFLLGTAAACEGARPGMLWDELPIEVPRHDYFPRYGPAFELYSPNWNVEDSTMSPTRRDGRYRVLMNEAKKALRVGIMYLQSQREKTNKTAPDFSAVCFDDDFSLMAIKPKKSKAAEAAFSKTVVVLSSTKSLNDDTKTGTGILVTKQADKKRKRRKRKHAAKQPEKVNSAS